MAAVEACPAEIAEYAWPAEQACSVSWCESRWQADAIGGSNYGWFQINAVHAWRVGYDLRLLLDGRTNTRVAYELWRDAGWGPWACKPW